jgi:O-antigen/teichoic acid export membrane protein
MCVSQRAEEPVAGLLSLPFAKSSTNSMSLISLTRIVRCPTIRGSVVSVIDQGVCSLSNFLAAVTLARTLAPEAFGVYSLYFASIMVLAGFQHALITGPARVLGVRPAGVDAGNYFKTLVRLQLILSAILAGGASVGLFILYPADPLSMGGFLLCLVLFQLQELARVINLTRMTFRSLLWLDLATHGLRIGLLLVAMRLGLLSPGAALFITAIACGLGMAVAGKNTYASGAGEPLKKVGAANWRYFRWILLEMIPYNASTQIYLYLTALWIDTVAAGGLSAVQSLMSAANLLLLGVMNHAVPVARQRLIEGGYDAWRKWLCQVGLFLAASTAAFGIIASIFATPFLALIYSPAYGAFACLMPIFAIQLFFTACNSALSAAFCTAEMPHVGFTTRATSAVVTLLIAYPLLKGWGVAGAAAGLVLTQVLWAAVSAGYVARGTLKRQIYRHWDTLTSARISQL